MKCITPAPPAPASLGTKVKLALWFLSAVAGGVLVGASTEPWPRFAGFALLAISPVGVIAAVMALAVLLLPVGVVCAIADHRAYKKTLREIDHLEETEGSERELDEAFAQLEKHVGNPPCCGRGKVSASSRQVEMGRRMLEENRPTRRRYLELADLESLEKAARRSDDPLAPFAWHQALERRHDDRLRKDVPDEGIIRLWARALEKDDFLALPPELRAPVQA